MVSKEKYGKLKEGGRGGVCVKRHKENLHSARNNTLCSLSNHQVINAAVMEPGVVPSTTFIDIVQIRNGKEARIPVERHI